MQKENDPRRTRMLKMRFKRSVSAKEEEEEEGRKTTAFAAERPDPRSPLRPLKLNRRSASWSESWLKNTTSLKNVIMAMQLGSPKESRLKPAQKTLNPNSEISDRTAQLSDQILLEILAKLPEPDRKPSALVCKRWLSLQGRLVRSVKVKDWSFVESGRVISRFPSLTQVDLVPGSLISDRNSGILLNHGGFSVPVACSGHRVFEADCDLVPGEVVDRGLSELGSGCPNLKKLVVIGASELGLLSIAEECPTLQELELHKCNDNLLRGIAACENLQVLKLVANVEGLYGSVVSDIGLTILAQGCTRLVKLELTGCEGSFDGIKAIGQCCQMLEELSFCDHRMDGGWLAALSYCENLKTLRFQSCKRIECVPGPDEYLGACPALENLHLQKCQLRDKKSVRALFMVCAAAREIVFQDCWGLDNDMFRLASICRRVTFLSLEGCSLLTTEGLESVILSWKELERLRVVSCKNIKDKDISPTLSSIFSTLIDMKWRPDTKSLLPSSIVGTSLGKKGSRFFRKSRDLKFLFDAP
ncbi:F-box protein At5g51380-like [Rosa rugosa]|uniref:F-box protein At5g51380-like n=1 Tax=Rosa rugosa TaxID=74645 RepID=UPI002B4128EE|nr:F-box protein At5g51380-like [Rosa rugosa]